MEKILKSVSLLWGASLGGAGLAFLTQVLLAREFTPKNYGVFAAALATITLTSPLAGFGVQGLWLKLFGKEGWGATRWLSASFRFVLVSTALLLLSLAVWATLGPHDARVQRLLYWLLPVVVGTLFLELVSGKLQLEERYGALALWQMLPHAFRFLLVFLVILASSKPHVNYIAASYSLAALFMTFLGLPHLKEMAKARFALKAHPESTMDQGREGGNSGTLCVLDFAREAWPFGLAGIFYLVYFQSDIILLKYLKGGELAGIYNVAFTVMAAIYLLPSVIYQKFLLPKIHRWANHDRSKFLQVYQVGNGVMLALGGVTTVGMLLVAPLLIPMLFGPEYQEATGLLMLLAFCAPVRFLATSVGATLVTQEHMRRKVYYMGTVAVVNLALNLLLIPPYAAWGAAAATLASEGTLLVLYLLAVRQHVFGPDAWRGWALTFGNSNV